MSERTRIESGYRNTKPSQDGTFSVYIKPEINKKLDMYCRLLNRNKTEVTNELVAAGLECIFREVAEALNK